MKRGFDPNHFLRQAAEAVGSDNYLADQGDEDESSTQTPTGKRFKEEEDVSGVPECTNKIKFFNDEPLNDFNEIVWTTNQKEDGTYDCYTALEFDNYFSQPPPKTKDFRDNILTPFQLEQIQGVIAELEPSTREIYRDTDYNDVLTFASKLRNDKRIAMLKLNRFLSDGSEDAAIQLMNALKTNKGVEDLIYPVPSDNIAKLLSEVLSVNTTLKSLDISGSGVSDVGFAYIVRALRNNRSLREFKASDIVKISDKSALELAETLNNNPILQSLSFSGNRGIRQETSLLAIMGAIGFYEQSNITLLDISHYLAEFEDVNHQHNFADAISQLLQFRPKITHMSFSGHQLTKSDAEIIARGLAHNRTIKRLELEENDISEKDGFGLAIADIARSLAGNQSITQLHLQKNGIRDAGATALSEMLRNNHSIEEIFLNRNFITSVGFNNIANAVMTNNQNKLKIINFNFNFIDGQAITTLLRWIETAKARNQPLETIYMNCNRIPEGSAANPSNPPSDIRTLTNIMLRSPTVHNILGNLGRLSNGDIVYENIYLNPDPRGYTEDNDPNDDDEDGDDEDDNGDEEENQGGWKYDENAGDEDDLSDDEKEILQDLLRNMKNH